MSTKPAEERTESRSEPLWSVYPVHLPTVLPLAPSGAGLEGVHSDDSDMVSMGLPNSSVGVGCFGDSVMISCMSKRLPPSPRRGSPLYHVVIIGVFTVWVLGVVLSA